MSAMTSPPQPAAPFSVSPAYWSLPADQLLQEVESAAAGLSSAEAQRRLQQVGPNRLDVRQKATPLRLFASQFKSPIIMILLLATVVSAVVQDWLDAVIILLIVLGSAALSFAQEYSASNAAEKLRAQVQIKATALRDGQPSSIPAEEIVPGDVLLLSAGNLIPADSVLLTAKDFFVNQAVLTGETFPVEKQPGVAAAAASLTERNNCLFLGANVRSGSATALAMLTGRATAFGQIANRLTLRPPETEFERGIRRLGYLLSEIMLILVLGIFAVNVALQKPVLDSLLFSIALAVGLTPQLLPAIINTNLAKGSQAMARSGVIVRRLASIENFGSMDVLCTDKTGTLTEGVVRLDGALDAQGQPSELVARGAFLNAHWQTGLTNPLDEAIVAGQAFDLAGVEKVDEIPYDFVRKRLSVVLRHAGLALPGAAPSDQPVLIAKGAFEGVLAACTALLDGAQATPLDEARRAQLQQRYADWSGQGYRVLGVAARPVEAKPVYQRDDEQALLFLGFLLFFDPPKPGVRETIADLAQLGVRLKIITGDNRLVAQHTAAAVGMPVDAVLTGRDLDEMHEEALWHAVDHTDLFAEVDPNQKERIVLALQKMGHVVGYMGDGINDAPALHDADIGISVDSAVDVAKEAADLVLLQRDLSVLRQGILAGRKTFANTQKYVFMATGANFGNMFSMAGASLLLPFLPMLPKQILLINLLTDLPEMTIASDNVDEEMVTRPRRWDVGFIRRFMLVFGVLSSVFDFITFGLLIALLHANQTLFHTGWFVESVVSASLVVISLRTRLPFFRGRPGRALLLATALVILAALALPYTPLAAPLGFAPLPLYFLPLIALVVAAYFASAEGAKRWFYRREARRAAAAAGAPAPSLKAL